MHEWALAEAVLETVRAGIKKEGMNGPVLVTVQLGELQSIENDVFAEGLKQLASAEDARVSFEFETEPAAFECTICGREWAFADTDIDEATREAIHFLPEVAHSFVSCPECGSADFSVSRGRGVAVSIARAQE